nr:phosphopentomutase [Clostridia bacterium]
MKRAFIIVLDSFGIGAEPDAHLFGDEGANTLESIHRSGVLSVPNMTRLGLGVIDGVDCLERVTTHTATVARLQEKSMGKDTTVGHWELMGVVSERPLPTYPDGFPKELIEKFEAAVGRGTLCNKPYSGTDVIRDFGEEHLRTGKLIVYTSADSVFQIAAHEELVPLPELYRCCEIARGLLTGKHGVGRVIARPFITVDGEFKRTANRHDYSLEPPSPTALTALKDAGYTVKSIGKINDIFAGAGITDAVYTHSNTEGIALTLDALREDFTGLCFTNLVDFDMLYGHRQDSVGYAEAMNEFDRALPELIAGIGEEDILIITADHGCDPSDDSTDHTREYIPLILYKKGMEPKNLGTLLGFDNVGALVCRLFGVSYSDNMNTALAEALGV